MSGLGENLSFERGRTYGAADNTLAVYVEGREYIFQDDQFGTGTLIRCRICRNNSGAALLPKRAVKFNLTAGKGKWDVAGYSTVVAEASGIVDDKLPAAGAPNGDLFFVVVEGPCLCKTAMTGDIANSIAVGDALQALTAVTTGATTAGRVGAAVFTGATAVLAGQIQGIIGYAMSALTTGQTNTDILVFVGSQATGRF